MHPVAALVREPRLLDAGTEPAAIDRATLGHETVTRASCVAAILQAVYGFGAGQPRR